jgi:hypothetical protein
MKVTVPRATPTASRGAAHVAWTIVATLGLLGAAVLWLVFNAMMAWVTQD